MLPPPTGDRPVSIEAALQAALAASASGEEAEARSALRAVVARLAEPAAGGEADPAGAAEDVGDRSPRPTAPAELLREAASLCEATGLLREAIVACRLLLEREPRDAPTWRRLAELHAERGDIDKARICRSRAEALEPPSPGRRLAQETGDLGDPAADSRSPAPTGDAGVRADRDQALAFDRSDVSRFLELFRGREDVHARQWFDATAGRGGYSPIREPLGASAVRAHLSGRSTLGIYLLRADLTVATCVLDLDLATRAVQEASGDPERVAELSARLEREASALVLALEELGLPFLFEDSGHKGRHCWILLDEPVPAAEALEFGHAFLSAHTVVDPLLHLEFFPKQDRPGERGLCNLVKLPLGIHRVSGRRGWLLDMQGEVHPQPFELLRSARRASRTALLDAASTLRARPMPSPAPRVPDAGDPEPEPARDPPARPARPAAPPWTEADFRKDPEFEAVLSGCPVLARLVRRALAGEDLLHDEVVSLRHTLGHLAHGPRGVNFLLARIAGLPHEQFLARRLRGSPASCTNLRRKLAAAALHAGCDCDFGSRLPIYPHPLLHLGDRSSTARLVALEGEKAGCEGGDPAARTGPSGPPRLVVALADWPASEDARPAPACGDGGTEDAAASGPDAPARGGEDGGGAGPPSPTPGPGPSPESGPVGDVADDDPGGNLALPAAPGKAEGSATPGGADPRGSG